MNRFARNALHEGRLYLANYVVAWIPSHAIRLFFYRHVMKARIGTGSSIFMGAWMDTPRGFTLGRGSTINQKCRLDSRGGITIGDNVSISAEVCILTADHDVQSANLAARLSAVAIDDYVFVGTRAMILPGVVLGKGSVVAAGAVVTKSVPPYAVVAGVPARPIGTRNQDLDYSVVYRRLFQ